MKMEKAATLVEALKAIAPEVEALAVSIRTHKDDDGAIFSLSVPIPPQNEPAAELFARLRMISGLGRTIRPDAISKFASDEELDMLSAAANGIINAVGSINKQLLAREKYKIPNPAKWIIQDTNTNAAFDLRPLFGEAYNQAERILKCASFFMRFKRTKDDDALLAQHASLTQLILTIGTEFEAVSENARASKELVDKQSRLLARAQELIQEFERLEGQASTDRKNIQEYASECANHLSSIRNTAAQAKELDASVSDYSAEFGQLQKEMDLRRDEILAGRRDVDKLVATVGEWTNKINDLIHRGEEMLSLTVSAGLAANYNSIVCSLTKELIWATRGFYIGIAVLLVSALPLFANAILPLAALFDEGLREYAKAIVHPNGSTPWDYVAQAFGRIVILVPAAWLVSFLARRHTALFKLREHYEYKYSLAASVEGFKKEASKYGDEIAATVFQELAFNPADKLDHKDLDNHKPPHAILAKALALFTGEREEAAMNAKRD